MTPIRLCLSCGKPTTGSRCEECERPKNAPWSRNRDRRKQEQFRNAVLSDAGYRCEWIEGGLRCGETRELFAHHVEPGNDDPETGMCLCREHHRLADRYAR